MAARGFIRKTMFLSNLVSRLQYRLFLPSKISIPLAISNAKSFFQTTELERERKLWCWCCDRSCRLSILKTAANNYSSSFFVLFTRPASPSGIYGSLLLPLVLLTTTARKKTLFAGIHVSSRGIAGFTDQRTAFTRAQSAILQGPDFNLRVERAQKIPYSRS